MILCRMAEAIRNTPHFVALQARMEGGRACMRAGLAGATPHHAAPTPSRRVVLSLPGCVLWYRATGTLVIGRRESLFAGDWGLTDWPGTKRLGILG